MIYQLKAYIKYFFLAKNLHGVHSPLVFDLLNEVFNNQQSYYAFDEIEFIKNQLSQSKNSIKQIEHGAGSRTKNESIKTVSTLVKKVSIPVQQGRWLFNLVRYFNPDNILEMGTCIGISTLYMALENKNRPIVTLEGNPDSANIAQNIFNKLGLKNILLLQGEFENTFETSLNQIKKIDFAFIDGNHRYEPTINYFNKILPFINEQTVLVFHDIHWSRGMEMAWHEIKNHPSVSVSIDVFFMGILIFRKGIVKQNFVLK